MQPETHDSDNARAERIGRALNAFLDRRGAGEVAFEQELYARHPDLVDELRAHCSMLSDLRPATQRVEALITQGLLQQSDDPAYQARLGPFGIMEALGRGGVGLVLKAHDDALGRVVALKILRPELADDEHAIARFTREARSAGALNHPNIVTVYAIGKERGVHFIAMEYVPGRSLADLIRNEGRLSAGLATTIFRQILLGLGAAHDAGLVHRDIKSANILLEKRADEPSTDCVKAKIADFGLARMRTSQTRLTMDNTVLGTPDYMSPEQARGDESIDHRTDLYSAGVVLYEMLSGRTPFATEDATTTIQRILHEPPQPPRELHADADRLLSRIALRLLAKRPEDRFATAHDVLAALDRGTHFGLPERARRRARLLFAGLALIMLAVVVERCVITLWRTVEAESNQLTAVWADSQGRDRVLGQRGTSNEPVVVRCLDAHEGNTNCAALVRATPQTSCVAVGVSAPNDACSLRVYDQAGTPLWQMNLSSDRQWPDCGPPTIWKCTAVIAADLDGAPGDEILAVAKDECEYPTRLSIIDPRTQSITATFWHAGELSEPLLVPDFFGAGRAAIVVTGLNNKLDGFAHSESGDAARSTTYDVVSIVAVLDPVSMNGFGPPRTARFADLEPIQPYAYAFLDAPPLLVARRRTSEAEPWIAPTADELAWIASIQRASYAAEDSNGPWFSAHIWRGDREHGSGYLILDRDLRPISFVRSMLEQSDVGLEDWRARWCVLAGGGPVARE